MTDQLVAEASRPGVYWDPYDTEIDTTPYEVWRALRDTAPVYHNEKYDFYALSRFADVEDASRQPLLFSSSHGTVLEMMGPEPYQTGMMIFNDPPRHTELRTLVSRAFTPRRVAAVEPWLREQCRRMLAAWDGGEFDLVEQFGRLLPAQTIAELLEVPAADRERVHHDIDESFHLEADKGMINDVSAAAMGRVSVYLNELVAQREAHPGDDLISALTQTELTHQEVVEFTTLLIMAGTETVGKLIGWAGILLGEHTDQQAWLRDNPDGVPAAVEELLRYEAPSPVNGRWTTAPVELHGVTIPADSKVLLLTGSAGRDERVYPDAHVFDVRRKFERHLSLGYGAHFCVGAALARLEGRVAVEETINHAAAFGGFVSDRAASTPIHTSTVRGWESVRVRGAG